MKKCQNCGAQVDDNSLFCTECGKQIPQGNACSHCGAPVNSGDSFCQNCGKSLKEIPNSESIAYEEESKSGFKKYLPYILGGVILLGIIAYCFFTKDDNSTDAIAIVDSASVEEAITSEQEIQAKKDFIEAFYQGFDQFNDSYIKKYVSPKALQILKDEYDYECEDGDCLGTWLFVYPPGTDCDFSTVVSRDIEKINENDYLVKIKYKDAYYGIIEYSVLLTVIKDGDTYKIDDIKDKVHTIVDDNSNSNSSNLDWLQGHWVYEQGSYKGHFIIQGDKIIQYSSMNPEHYDATFRIEDGEIRARLVDGMDLAVPIDYVNQRIDYGDGCWMHKVSSSSDNGSNPYIGKTYKGGGYVGGLYTEMTITFLDSNNCRCVSDWYQSYPEGKSLNGTYKIKDGHIIVHCAYDGDDYDFDFGVKENGRFIGFDHSDHSLGRMGSNSMTLELLD